MKCKLATRACALQSGSGSQHQLPIIHLRGASALLDLGHVGLLDGRAVDAHARQADPVELLVVEEEGNGINLGELGCPQLQLLACE